MKYNNGFTFIEVLISITLLSLISIIAGSAFYMIDRTAKSYDKAVSNSINTTLTTLKLYKVFENATLYILKKDGKQELVFNHTAKELLFVSNYSIRKTHTGPSLYYFKVENDQEKASLVFYEKPLYSLNDFSWPSIETIESEPKYSTNYSLADEIEIVITTRTSVADFMQSNLADNNLGMLFSSATVENSKFDIRKNLSLPQSVSFKVLNNSRTREFHFPIIEDGRAKAGLYLGSGNE